MSKKSCCGRGCRNCKIYKMKKRCLYLDDVRTPLQQPEGYQPWVVVRNYDEFVQWITENGIPEIISFDHDLAEEHMNDYYKQILEKNYQEPDYNSYTEKTGLDCAKWLCAYSKDNSAPLYYILIHSHNPIGATNIQTYINNYLKSMGWEQSAVLHKTPFKIDKHD